MPPAGQRPPLSSRSTSDEGTSTRVDGSPASARTFVIDIDPTSTGGESNLIQTPSTERSALVGGGGLSRTDEMMQRKQQDSADVEKGGAMGGAEAAEKGGLPLPATAARPHPHRGRSGTGPILKTSPNPAHPVHPALPHPDPVAPASGSQRTVRAVPPPSRPLHQQARQAWRSFVRRVQAAGSSPSESITGSGTGGASGSVGFVGRADKIAGEVVARDMAEKEAMEKRRRRDAERARAANVSDGTGIGTLTRRFRRRNTNAAKTATEVSGSVRFVGEVPSSDEDEPEEAKEHEMVVLDQGLSDSNGWAKRFAPLGGSGYHPSAPTDDDPEGNGNGTHHHGNGGGKASHTYSTTGGQGGWGEDEHPNAGCWGRTGLGTWIRWRLWPRMHSFYDLSFMDPKEEKGFRKEQWCFTPLSRFRDDQGVADLWTSQVHPSRRISTICEDMRD